LRQFVSKKGITLFRKNSFLGVNVFAGSLTKTYTSLSKVPLVAGPFSITLNYFFWTLSPFDMVKDVHDFEELYYIPPFLSLAQASSSPYAEYCRALQYRLSLSSDSTLAPQTLNVVLTREKEEVM
jgi:hypothetical protein